MPNPDLIPGKNQHSNNKDSGDNQKQSFCFFTASGYEPGGNNREANVWQIGVSFCYYCFPDRYKLQGQGQGNKIKSETEKI